MRKKLDYTKITRRDDSLLANYMRLYENVETSEAYDFWSGVWLLSSVLGRKITVARPQAPVFLNVYAILCAESGITRKSTAVSGAVELLNEWSSLHYTPLHVMSGGTTAEGLDKLMAVATAETGQSHVCITSSELVNLLGKERYNASLPGRLTDFYDCPAIYTRQTAGLGRVDLRNIYVTLLGASTPSWLVRAVNPDVVEGGFTSRCLFIIEEKPKRLIAWPDAIVDTGLRKRVLDQLASTSEAADHVRERAGGIHLSAVARRVFTDWYEHRAMVTDAYGSSFQAREDHHVLRLAGLLAASDGSWEIDDHHIHHCIQAIQHVRSMGSTLFGSGIATSRTYSLVDRVRGALVGAGKSGLSQSALSVLCRRHGTSEEIRDVLTIMHEMNLVQRFNIETGDRGRPTVIYRATRAIASARVMDSVVEQLVPQED
jgi:hypothetical protein